MCVYVVVVVVVVGGSGQFRTMMIAGTLPSAATAGM